MHLFATFNQYTINIVCYVFIKT